MDTNPRAVIGANKPPLDDADALPARLDERHIALTEEAMNLDMERLLLKAKPETDEECGALTSWVARAKALQKKFEDARKEEGAPYLAGQRAVNSYFKELDDPVEASVKDVTGVIGHYNKAKAERERAERAERERQERERAEAARKAEQEAREAADKAAQEAEEAAARIRQADGAAAREKAAQEMRERDEAAEKLRKEAEAKAEEAAKAERKAESHERAQGAGNTALSRVHGEGGTSSITKRWSYRIEDVGKLRASLGPLGRYFGYADLETTIARAVREQSQGGGAPDLKLPGVDLFQIDNVNVRAARGR